MVAILVLLVVIVILKRSYPKVKGAIGEKKVNGILSNLPSDTYRIWNDLYVPNKKKGTSQIDHVVLTNNGLFVIETKNYQGWIFGHEQSQYWTQSIYKRKERFHNPIWQNYGHIRALKELLQEDLPNEFPIYSIIVFSDKATLKSTFENASVINNKQLLSTIKELNSNIFYEAIPLKSMIEKITKYAITDKKLKKQISKQHIIQIREDRKLDSQKIKQNICPRCGSSLVERKRKNGSFIGCSGFPKCRYTR
ncbi:NERD domain-containing protein [Bacillus sp. B1-b2]|uniref:NERD domain-containing protein n=1 Tax=Bacillus sp. B1-b2 TaxID=2653201 RepID=UPI001261D8A8|nr:NERD domain-containing protein [Bacillus sp. B1-b2]KAB7665878.1 NERD domain-containing protein [Bacillus sp. B1-b2]